jgi:ABC-type histidine transport system ATPase subunit
MNNDSCKVEFRSVRLSFGDRVVLDGVNFRLRAGELKMILGASGSGKSTILRLILGLIKPDDGEIFIDEEEILLNAIEHGAGFDPELVVEVAALRSQRAIVYYFRDPGPGFNRENLPHAAVSNTLENPIGHIEYREAHGMRPAGFGIMMTKQLVDEVIYNEIGNEVLLIKHTC